MAVNRHTLQVVLARLVCEWVLIDIDVGCVNADKSAAWVVLWYSGVLVGA